MKWVLPSTYENPVFPYTRSADQDADSPVRHQVVIAGAGPTGMLAALDLAKRGIGSIILSKEETVSIGSRAICFAKRTLEIGGRIAPEVGKRWVDKGVIWNVGKVFHKSKKVYEFNLLPEAGHKIPAFINLQQYYFEEYILDEIHKNPLIEIRWHNTVTNVSQDHEKVTVDIKTPDGPYTIEADYLLGCDGVHSTVRNSLGLPYEGETFEENFLIADIVMKNEFPPERWFWFDPPFNKEHSALLHKQPDNVWRIDLQLGWDIDKDKELEPESIKRRLKQMLGDDVKFELEWTSIYTFRCMRMPEFVHGRTLFLGDSAHLVSPFGARGANGGVQDVDNLIWKLALVMKGLAPKSLLESYNIERSSATDENIMHSSQATDFITPKSKVSREFRDAALELAQIDDSAKKLVNSGRLSHAFKYLNSPLTSKDTSEFGGSVQPGYPVADAPLQHNNQNVWLSDNVGDQFKLVIYTDQADYFVPGDLAELINADIPIETQVISSVNSDEHFTDIDGYYAERYDAKPETWYLFRPDQHIAARGRSVNIGEIINAFKKCVGQSNSENGGEIVDQNPTYNDQNYNALIKAHADLSEEESEKLNKKLILQMLNKVDHARFAEMLDMAINTTGSEETIDPELQGKVIL